MHGLAMARNAGSKQKQRRLLRAGWSGIHAMTTQERASRRQLADIEPQKAAGRPLDRRAGRRALLALRPLLLAASLAGCGVQEQAVSPNDGLIKNCANGGHLYRNGGVLLFREKYNPWFDAAEWQVSPTADLKQVCP